MPPDVAAVLATVCGYHRDDGCTHCADTYDRSRREGRTDRQIVVDATEYRDNYPAWYWRHVDEAVAAGRMRPGGYHSVPRPAA